MHDHDSALGGPRYARLTPAQCAQLHHASLTILERTGVRLFEPAAIDLLKKAGAAVDGDRVRIPARLVDQALQTVPKSVTLFDPYAEPDHRGMMAALAHYYGLPMFSLAGGSDAKLVDQQAAIDAALTLAVESISGGHLIHDLGYLESGLTFSLAQLAICDEIVAWLKPFLRPVEINDETLALDLIDQFGPDGSFLNTPHTRQHYRERWYPNLIERFNYSQWEKKGGETLGQRAADKVEALLATHQPEPLSAAAATAVHAIVERAAQQAA